MLSNPMHLEGVELKALAHARGIAKSELDTMSDVKIRQQLAYIDARLRDDDAETSTE